MRMQPHLLGLGLAAASFGCGSKSNDLGAAGGPGSSHGPGLDAGPSTDNTNMDATLPSGDPAQHFVPSLTDDAGIVTMQGFCTPGVYEGKFMTYVGAGGDGGSAGPFSFMWNGSLTLDLRAQKITMTSMTAGELPTTTSTNTLEIADGGALDGSDTMGGSFFANLSGKLDCSPDAGPPFHLTATLSNGGYSLGGFLQLAIVGTLTADYVEAGTLTPPMLANGAILVGGVLTDGGAPFASARGTWSAFWVSAPPP
jgi:hypothetical protein